MLQVHGEVTDPDVDVFDREQRVHRARARAAGRARPGAEGRVRARHDARRRRSSCGRARAGVAATITPQHLLLNRNALFEGGIRPHHYCLPVLKRERDREALIEAATSDDARFFLGTDSAPHARHAKERPAAARASSPRTRRSSCMPRRSSRPGARAARGVRRASAARISTACRAMRARSSLEREPWTGAGQLPVRRRTSSCRCAPVRTLALAAGRAHERVSSRRSRASPTASAASCRS